MGRIDGLQPGGLERALGGRGVGGTAPAMADGRKVTDRAEGTDRATLSTRGRLVANAISSVRAAPEVRADRVAALKAAIAEGRYSIDLDAIARRLIAAGIGERAP